ncbi:MAG TPA: hypothetical protein VK636_03335 [Gemmatimonadaceae bacterium]|nr:hypothetical protein [Gemmatimonadaceae bacterium]
MSDLTEAQAADGTGEAGERRAYVAPTLIDYGAIDELTEGTFAGIGVDFGIYS